jgi:hypothetical protein
MSKPRCSKQSNSRSRCPKKPKVFEILVISETGFDSCLPESDEARDLLMQHWDALRKYVATGDPSGLGRFANQSVGGVVLVSASQMIDHLVRTEDLTRFL